MAAGCQLFYRKIYGYFLQCGVGVSPSVHVSACPSVGWSGGAMALGKLPVPRRPTNLD